MNDLHNNSRGMNAITPVLLGATGVITGTVIDRQGYGGVEFIINYGTIVPTGAVITPTVYESDTATAADFASAADAYLLGTEALAALPAASPRVAGTSKEVVKRVGYVGIKRYVRMDLNHTAAAATAATNLVCAAAILHSPEVAPVDNP